MNLDEPKTHLGKYLRQVEQGEVIVVCRDSNQSRRSIAPAPNRATRTPGLLKGGITWTPETFASLTDAELADFDPAPVAPQLLTLEQN